MAPQILQINVTFSSSAAELQQAWLAAANPIANTDGLRWKVWLMNEQRHEAGGVYLFDDEDTLRAFLAGPIANALKNDPVLSNLSVKQFDVMEEHTAITRGPVREATRV